MANQGIPLSQLSDQGIARGIKAGSIKRDLGLQELVIRRVPDIWRILSKRYKLDREFIDDIVAQTVLVIWEKFETFDPDRGEFIAWAVGIANNKLIDAWYREEKYRELSIAEIEQKVLAKEDIEGQFEHKEILKKALEAIMSFPELDRTLFFLKSNYDLKYDELAEILNMALEKEEKRVTSAAVRQRFYLMRKKLKKLLEDQ